MSQSCGQCSYFVAPGNGSTCGRCEYPTPVWLHNASNGGYTSAEDGACCGVFKPQIISDVKREQLIAQKALELQTAKTQAARRKAWNDMQALINGRSIGQISRMEDAISPPPPYLTRCADE